MKIFSIYGHGRLPLRTPHLDLPPTAYHYDLTTGSFPNYHIIRLTWFTGNPYLGICAYMYSLYIPEEHRDLQKKGGMDDLAMECLWRAFCSFHLFASTIFCLGAKFDTTIALIFCWITYVV
jgi:hypothetical protein